MYTGCTTVTCRCIYRFISDNCMDLGTEHDASEQREEETFKHSKYHQDEH